MPESVVHFQIRMPPQQHEKLASWAKDEKLSLNLLVVGILEKAIEKRLNDGAAPKGGAAHAGK
jgi:predicted HicB family RNase H-like nuclease